MNISHLSTDTFFSCVSTVYQKLDDPEERGKLLSEARSDTPIIEGLTRQIAMLHALEGHGESRPEAITMAHRDLVIFLSLREMSRREQTVQAARFN